jgi:predicted transcriptional regulator
VVENSERDDTEIYDIVNPQIIDPLKDREYVRLHHRSNKKILTITSKGEDALEISKYDTKV